jgi:hypothetical protein
MQISGISEGDEEPGVGDSPQCFANPFRLERSRGPRLTLPARRMKFLPCLSPRRSCSSCSRTICPCDIPVRSAFFCNQVESGFATRMVIVLLIGQNRNTRNPLSKKFLCGTDGVSTGLRFQMMASEEFEEDEAEAGAGVEEPEVRGRHRFVEAADPEDEGVAEEEGEIIQADDVGVNRFRCRGRSHLLLAKRR